ncbi:MAG: wax ester/triacylglycerol synthase domain-containing protein [Acidimicrobiales bacterium]
MPTLTLLDRAPDMDRLRQRLSSRPRGAPPGPAGGGALGRLAPPEWRDDPDFDLDFHVREVALGPGRERQLFDLVAKLAADPLDRTRPLWEFTVIGGLEGGRAAMLQKMHTITDGEGVRMSVQFIDIARDTPDPDLPPLPTPASNGRSLFDTAVETLSHNLRRQAGLARRGLESATGAVIHPTRLTRLAGDALEMTRSATRQVVVTDERHSPLWTARSLRRHFDALQVPLDEAKQAAAAVGASVNDLFVAGAAGGAGAYHRARDADVDELRISMPVSTRSDKSAGGNAFAPSRVLVPVGPDPRARLVEIHERLSVTKHERALGLTSALAGRVNVLPTSVLVRMARSQVETVDFATSNVRGAPWELFIAGARIDANYPLGPVAGTAFNLTTMSSNGSLDMGLHVDSAAVEDPELLRQCLEESFAELLKLR